METQLLFNMQRKGRYQDIELRSLVSKLIAGVQSTAEKHNSIMVNDISPDTLVTTDENFLASIINQLLAVIVSRNHNSCIRITAKVFSNVVLLYVRDQNTKVKNTSLSEFDELQPLAAKVGGCVSVNNHEENSETFALSFIDFAHIS